MPQQFYSIWVAILKHCFFSQLPCFLNQLIELFGLGIAQPAFKMYCIIIYRYIVYIVALFELYRR